MRLEKQNLIAGLAFVLTSLWPFLNFWATNLIYDTNFNRWLAITALYFVLIFGLAFTFWYLTRKHLKLFQIFWAFQVATFLFFNYQIFQKFLTLPLFFWFLAFISLPIAVTRLTEFKITPVLFGISIWLNVIPVQKMIQFYFFEAKKPEFHAEFPEELRGLKFLSNPNVYYLVLDGYGNAQEIKASTGIDLTNFNKGLESRGFYNAQLSQTNYIWTHLALAAALDMRLVIESGKNVVMDRTILNPIIQGNSIARKVFKNNGYQYLHYENNQFDATQCRGIEDECIERVKWGISGVGRTLLQLTPFDPIRNLLGIRDSNSLGFERIFEETQKYVRAKTPFFVFAHIYSPHPPNWLKSDCSRRRYNNRAWSPGPYREQVECMNRALLDFIDKVVAVDPTAVFIIHGDHGPAFQNQNKIRLKDWNLSQVMERTRIFNAYRYPGDCTRQLYQQISPVNSLRVLIGCLSQTKIERVPDRVFLTQLETHPDFGLSIEVFDRPTAGKERKLHQKN